MVISLNKTSAHTRPILPATCRKAVNRKVNGFLDFWNLCLLYNTVIKLTIMQRRVSMAFET